MSELRVASINNPSAGSGGLAISAAGNVTGAGLDLIVTQSFSAVSSVSLDNCFSGDYDNYRVLFDLAVSVDADLNYRFRASASDDTNTTYRNQASMLATGTWASLQSTGTATFFFIGSGDLPTYPRIHGDLMVGTPHDSLVSRLYGMTHGARSGTSTSSPVVTGGHFENTTSFDGFTLYPSAGTITGTVSVYGYKS